MVISLVAGCSINGRLKINFHLIESPDWKVCQAGCGIFPRFCGSKASGDLNPSANGKDMRGFHKALSHRTAILWVGGFPVNESEKVNSPPNEPPDWKLYQDGPGRSEEENRGWLKVANRAACRGAVGEAVGWSLSP